MRPKRKRLAECRDPCILSSSCVEAPTGLPEVPSTTGPARRTLGLRAESHVNTEGGLFELLASLNMSFARAQDGAVSGAPSPCPPDAVMGRAARPTPKYGNGSSTANRERPEWQCRKVARPLQSIAATKKRTRSKLLRTRSLAQRDKVGSRASGRSPQHSYEPPDQPIDAVPAQSLEVGSPLPRQSGAAQLRCIAPGGWR